MTAFIVVAAMVLSWALSNASEAELCAILMAFILVAFCFGFGGYFGV